MFWDYFGYFINRKKTMIATKGSTYFCVSTVQEMLDDICVRGDEIPSCLDNNNLDDPLEAVFVLTSEVAVQLAQAIATIEVNSAIEAFHRQIMRQVEQLPQGTFKCESFFQVRTVESVMNDLDNCEQDFSTFLVAKPVVLPTEVVIVLTHNFAVSIWNVLRRTQPQGILKLFGDRLNEFLSQGG